MASFLYRRAHPRNEAPPVNHESCVLRFQSSLVVHQLLRAPIFALIGVSAVRLDARAWWSSAAKLHIICIIGRRHKIDSNQCSSIHLIDLLTALVAFAPAQAENVSHRVLKPAFRPAPAGCIGLAHRL